MIRAVLDTNVVVSAALQPSGPSGAILRLAGLGLVQPWLSKAIFEEYKEVLYRFRVGVAPDRAKRLLRLLPKISRRVEPTRVVRAALDPDDNIFLECAQAAKAQYLITGNVADFPVRWKYTRIVTPRQFVDDFEDSATSSRSQ
jgi:putative PIN family toxin of toxin-antitoxin system